MPTLQGHISFTVKFNLTLNKLSLQFSSDISSPDIEGITAAFDVRQPDGLIRNGNTASPDVSWNGSGFPEFTLPLRLASDGNPQRGTYFIQVSAIATGYDAGIFSREFNYQFELSELKVTTIFDVFTPSLSATDETQHDVPEYTTNTLGRSWQAEIPAGVIIGSASSIDLAYSGAYYDSLYKIHFGVNATYTNDIYSWLTVVAGRSKYFEKPAFIPPAMAILFSWLSALKLHDDGCDCGCGCSKSAYDKALALYKLIREKVCAQDTDCLNEMFNTFYSLTHNGAVWQYTNTNLVIPPYDFTTGCSGNSPGLVNTGTVVVECIIGNTAVVTGTVYTVSGLTNGSDTVTSDAFIDKRVRVVRGALTLPGQDPGDGSYYYTKIPSANNIILNSPLVTGEFIRIETIS